MSESSSVRSQGGETVLGRFYDNDPKNFNGAIKQTVDGVRKKFFQFNKDGKRYLIECIHVDDTLMNPWVTRYVRQHKGDLNIDGKTYLPTLSPSLSEGLSLLYFYNYYNEKEKKGNITSEDNLFFDTIDDFKFSDQTGHLLTGYHEDHLPSKGITIGQIQELRKWCRDHRNQSKVVFFDWDKTLTVLEGFIIFSKDKSNFEKYICAHAEYLFGGKARMERLKRMFSFLQRYGVQVYILTNNTTVYNISERPYFVALIKCVYPTFDEKTQLIGSYIYPSKKQALRYLWTPVQESRTSRKQDSETQRQQRQQQQQKRQQQLQQQQMKQQKQRVQLKLPRDQVEKDL
jgi:hypothetical protein